MVGIFFVFPPGSSCETTAFGLCVFLFFTSHPEIRVRSLYWSRMENWRKTRVKAWLAQDLFFCFRQLEQKDAETYILFESTAYTARRASATDIRAHHPTIKQIFTIFKADRTRLPVGKHLCLWMRPGEMIFEYLVSPMESKGFHDKIMFYGGAVISRMWSLLIMVWWIT